MPCNRISATLDEFGRPCNTRGVVEQLRKAGNSILKSKDGTFDLITGGRLRPMIDQEGWKIYGWRSPYGRIILRSCHGPLELKEGPVDLVMPADEVVVDIEGMLHFQEELFAERI